MALHLQISNAYVWYFLRVDTDYHLCFYLRDKVSYSRLTNQLHSVDVGLCTDTGRCSNFAAIRFLFVELDNIIELSSSILQGSCL